MTNTIENKVRKGIKYLLDRGYSNRLHEVSTRRLVMNNNESCVIGQMFGEYGDGLEILGLDYDVAYDLGFNGSASEIDGLTVEWSKALNNIDNYLYGSDLNNTPEVKPEAKPAAVGVVNGNLVLRTGSGAFVTLPLNQDGFFDLEYLNAFANANK